MDLNEYIKMSYKRPNRKVLEGLGASENLIEYLMETPWNTNLNVIGSIAGSGSGEESEVWLVGSEYQEYSGMRSFTLINIGETDHVAELIENGENYKIYLNGEELSYYHKDEGTSYKDIWWTDNSSDMTKQVAISVINDEIYVLARYIDASTAPTSVEVSVEAK